MNKKPKGNSAFLLENEKIDENTFQIMFGTDVHLGHQEMISINSQAVGMAVARLHGFEIDYVRNPISGSAGCFTPL